MALPMTTPSTIGRDGRDVVRTRDAESKREGDIRMGAHPLDEGRDAGGDGIALAGDACEAHAVDETAGALRNGLDAFIGACWGNQVDKVKAVTS